MKTTYANYTNNLLLRTAGQVGELGTVIFLEDGQCSFKAEMWTPNSQSRINIDVTAGDLRNMASILLRTADEIDAIKAGLQEVAA